MADPDCRATDLAHAITFRQCTKAPCDGHQIDQDHLAALAPAEPRYGVRTIVLTDTAAMQDVAALVERGNRAQLTDPAFRDELLSWIRLNDRESLASGDGLAGRTMGSPSIPTWLAKRLLPLLVTAKRQVKTDTANIASSAGIAVFVTDGNNVSDWVNAGRCYERFALQATALDICNAFINQPIEARRRIGVLSHASGLYPHLTARENIEYFAVLHGLSRALARQRADELAALLDLHEIMDRRAKGFSQGQRLKTALARAMVHSPRNLILDEPTNGLDVMAVRALRHLLERLRDAGHCILFSSHVMQEVAMLCDHVVVIAHGRVVADGSIEALRTASGEASLEDAFVKLIGSAEGIN